METDGEDATRVDGVLSLAGFSVLLGYFCCLRDVPAFDIGELSCGRPADVLFRLLVL